MPTCAVSVDRALAGLGPRLGQSVRDPDLVSPSPGSRRVLASTRRGGVFQLTAQRIERFLLRYNAARDPSPARSSLHVLTERVPSAHVPRGIARYPSRPGAALPQEARDPRVHRRLVRLQRLAPLCCASAERASATGTSPTRETSCLHSVICP